MLMEVNLTYDCMTNFLIVWHKSSCIVEEFLLLILPMAFAFEQYIFSLPLLHPRDLWCNVAIPLCLFFVFTVASLKDNGFGASIVPVYWCYLSSITEDLIVLTKSNRCICFLQPQLSVKRRDSTFFQVLQTLVLRHLHLDRDKSTRISTH